MSENKGFWFHVNDTVSWAVNSMRGRMPPEHNNWGATLTAENAIEELRKYNNLPWIQENYVKRTRPPYHGSDWFLETFEIVLTKITPDQVEELGRYVAGCEVFRESVSQCNRSAAIPQTILGDLFKLCPDHQTQNLLEILDTQCLLTFMAENEVFGGHVAAYVFYDRLSRSRESTEDTIRYLKYCRPFEIARPTLFHITDHSYPEYKCLF